MNCKGILLILIFQIVSNLTFDFDIFFQSYWQNISRIVSTRRYLDNKMVQPRLSTLSQLRSLVDLERFMLLIVAFSYGVVSLTLSPRVEIMFCSKFEQLYVYLFIFFSQERRQIFCKTQQPVLYVYYTQLCVINAICTVKWYLRGFFHDYETPLNHSATIQLFTFTQRLNLCFKLL